jgi:hypothetical protein
MAAIVVKTLSLPKAMKEQTLKSELLNEQRY